MWRVSNKTDTKQTSSVKTLWNGPTADISPPMQESLNAIPLSSPSCPRSSPLKNCTRKPISSLDEPFKDSSPGPSFLADPRRKKKTESYREREKEGALRAIHLQRAKSQRPWRWGRSSAPFSLLPPGRPQRWPVTPSPRLPRRRPAPAPRPPARSSAPLSSPFSLSMFNNPWIVTE